MRHSFFTPALLFAVISILLSCTPASGASPDETKASPTHIIILGFDGWGASSYELAEMPFLKKMVSESAWTLKKRSILPSSSACNWASMFKGAGPEAHGYIDWDTRKPAFDITFADAKGQFPSFFSIFREAFPDYEMGYLYQWEGMMYLFDMADFNYTKKFEISPAGSTDLMDAAISYIEDKKPAVAALIWDYPDKIGHTTGWYTIDYMKELTHIDSIIESIVTACEKAGIMDSTLFVVTSDHGGHNKTHGQALMSDLEAPFIMFGPGVQPGMITDPMMQYDVAAVLADYMHLDIPKGWRGRSPSCIFK